MALLTPYYTSNDLIAAVQRKIAFPIAQNTFSNQDILAFANDELMESQIAAVMQYHEEYFVYSKVVPMISNQSVYPIPDRSIGMRLRGLFYQDTATPPNLFDMTRTNPDNKAFFQKSSGASQVAYIYFIKGNDIYIAPGVTTSPSGSLLMDFFLRPNQLTTNDQAAIINGFGNTVTINNATLANGDILTVTTYNDAMTPTFYNFTAVSGAPSANQFQIGATSIVTATNLANLLATQIGIVLSATNGTVAVPTNVVTVLFPLSTTSLSTLNTDGGFTIPQTTSLISFNSIPSSITSGSLIDFLQTKPGHRTYNYDVTIPLNAISSNIITFNNVDIPRNNPLSLATNYRGNIILGDYICNANQCIIPQIPPELHSGLAERTASRILASLGDMTGLQASNAKIQELEKLTGTLVDDRVEGNAQKILNRHSLLRYGKTSTRRRV